MHARIGALDRLERQGTGMFSMAKAVTGIAGRATARRGAPNRAWQGCVLAVLGAGSTQALAQSMTHNTSLTPVSGATQVCGTASTSDENSYLRSFNFAFFGITQLWQIESIDFAVEVCTVNAPVRITLYAAGLPNTYAGLGAPIATQNLILPPGALYNVNVPFPPVVFNPATTPNITVEIVTFDLTPLGGMVKLGSNAHGQTGPNYVAAPACSLANPTDTSSLGMSKMQTIMRLNGPCAQTGGPSTTQTYVLCGNANNIGWSWQIDGQASSYTYSGNVPGVATGGSPNVAHFFANDLLSACSSVTTNVTPLPPCGGSGGPSSAQLDITITDGPLTTFDLYVGPFGGAATTLVPIGTPVTFNPAIQRVILSGNDCNSNGHDDAIDIATGNSLDTDGDGIPNECDCAADFDGDGFLTGLDYAAFVLAFEAGDLRADFDGDGYINAIDFDDYVRAFELGC